MSSKVRGCAVLLVLLAGCGDPPSGVFRCDTDEDCPSGQMCRVGAAAAQPLCYATAGSLDAGPAEDAGLMDAGPDDGDAGVDAGLMDAGPDDGDSGPSDAGPSDAGPSDAGPDDAGSCMLSCSGMGGTVCRPYRCDDTSGTEMCVPSDAVDGTACEDGDICTWGTGCSTGLCGTSTNCEATAQLVDSLLIGAVGFLNEPYESPVACPLGESPIGLTGAVATNGGLAGMRIHCGRLDLVPSGLSYEVQVTPSSSVPSSEMGATRLREESVTVMCPANEVVVGMGGTWGDADDDLARQITLRCAAMTLTGDFQTGYRIQHEMPTSATLGTDVGTQNLPPVDCPPNLIGSGFNSFWGDVVNGIALRCGEPFVRSITTGPLEGLTRTLGFTSDCPEGSYLIGSDVNTADTGTESGHLIRLTPQCGRFTVYRDTSLRLGHLSDSASPGEPFGVSAVAGPRVEQRCPGDEVVVGIEGGLDAEGILTEFALHCARLTPVAGPSGHTLSIGLSGAQTPSVSGTTVTRFGPHLCPAGTVALGLMGNADRSWESVALRCTLPNLPLTTRLILLPTEDAHVVSSMSTMTYGSAPTLLIEAGGFGDAGQTDLLVKWNISAIPANHSISWAELQMSAQTTSTLGGDPDIYAHRSFDGWDETVTWATAPDFLSYNFGALNLAFGGGAETGRLQSANFQEAVRGEVALDGIFSVRFRSEGSLASFFGRGAADSQQPTLEVYHRAMTP